MLSGLQNGIQWEIREWNFVSHGKGVLWRKPGIPINLGHNGVRVCLVKGMLIDVMLSIPLMQGTARGLPHGGGYMLYSFCRFGKSRRGQQLYILSHLG